MRPSRAAKSIGVKPDLQRAACVSAPALDEQPDDVGVAVVRRPHQGGLALAVLRVHFRAGVEQRPHGADAAGAGGGHQRGLAAAERGVRRPRRPRAAVRTMSALPFVQASDERRDAVAVLGLRARRRRRSGVSPPPARRDTRPSAGPSCRPPGRRWRRHARRGVPARAANRPARRRRPTAASRVAAGAVDGAAAAGAAERATAHHPATMASTRAAAVVVLRIRRCWFMVITNHFAAAPAPAEAPAAAGAGISFESTAQSTNRCGHVPNGMPLRGVIEPPWPPVP